MAETVSCDTSRGLVRFGVICSGATLHAWQARCLDNLLQVGEARLALIMIGDEICPARSFPRELRRGLKHICFRLLRWSVRPRALRRVGMTELFSQVPKLHCRVVEHGQFGADLTGDDLRKIRGHELSFILNLGPWDVDEKLPNAARMGVWAFRLGTSRIRNHVPCFWEIYNGELVTEAALQKIGRSPYDVVVLRKGALKTINGSYSRSIDAVFSEIADWPAQVCKGIRRGADPSHPVSGVENLEDRLPDNLRTLRFMLKLVRNALAKTYDDLFHRGEWNVGIVHKPIHAFLKPGMVSDVYWLPALGNSKFRSDPFGVAEKGNLRIVCEEFDYGPRKGVISAVELTTGASAVRKDVAIHLPFHMSYPYLLEHEGEIYCIPETFQAGEVGLYKAQEFPWRWVKVATLISGVACIDSTVFQYDGRWWLTCTDQDEDPHLKLFVWHAPDLFGPWEPHAANPVKVDIRSARPAGTPFVHDGVLYRPAQDCSGAYGGGIVINRVTRLTPTQFEEEPAAVVGPLAGSPYPDGTHTISAVGDITLIDAKRDVFIRRAFVSASMREMGKIGIRAGALLRRSRVSQVTERNR